MDAMCKEVELGFLEETESWRLESDYFPSKVGGKPAWLALEKLPKDDELACTTCKKPCVFLLQVYAPLEEKTECFHRILFIFMCKNPECCKSNSFVNFKVFRSQLPRENKFYSSEAPDQDYFDSTKPHPSAAQYQELCLVCGAPGSKQCGKCHRAKYCGKEHQTIDWKAGHKKICGSEKEKVSSSSDSFLFPQYELVTEPEDLPEKSEKSDQQKMKEYAEFLKSDQAEGLLKGKDNVVDKDLNDMAKKETVADKMFHKFKKRIQFEPEQVLRYQHKGEVLWVSDEALPSAEDIPSCSCGAKRVFEFQILPQLLNHLKVDSLGASVDWGTLAVYTCEASCTLQEKLYAREFIWKQDFSEKDI